VAEYSASFWEQAWGDYYERLAGVLWDKKPPEYYLRKVAYVWERRNRAAKREDEQRIAAGEEPLWNL
jgi:hypothetical protein